MTYIVIEIQKDSGTVSTLTTTFTDQNEAEAKFYQVMSVAAVSTLDRHGASVMTEDGNVYLTGTYEH